MYFYLPNITELMYVQLLREIIFPPIEITVEICKQITILILYEVSSRLVTS
jgi:hypothetical protein